MAPSVPDYSRKHKSLGLLCQNFLATYGTKNDEDICLDMAAERLNVERRRIYDIVNVLESVGIVLRRAKNTYVWMGQEQLELTLKYLHKEAMELQQAKASNDKTINLPPTNPMTKTINNNSNLGSNAGAGEAGPSSFKTPNKTNAQASPSKDASNINNLSGKYQVVKDTGILAVRPAETPVATATVAATAGGASATPMFETITPAAAVAASASASKSESSRKEKALGVLSQRFVCLFLVDPDRTLSLEEAASALIDPNQPPVASPSPGIKVRSNSINADDPDDDEEGNGESSVQMKTRVRRLYDIANILASLGLIDKRESFRRPSFTWRGPRYDTHATIQSSPANPTRFVLRVGEVPASPATGGSKIDDKSSSKKRKTPSRPKAKGSEGKIEVDGIDLNSKLDDENDRNEGDEDEDEDGVRPKKRRDDLMPWEKASPGSKIRKKGKADPKGKDSSSKEDKNKLDTTTTNLMNVFSSPDMFQAGYQQIMAPFMASMMMGNSNPASMVPANTGKKGGTPAGGTPGMPAGNQSMLLQQQMAMLSAMMQNGLGVPMVPKPETPGAPEESVAPSSRSSKIAPPLPSPAKPALLPQVSPVDAAVGGVGGVGGGGGGHTLLTNEEVDEYMRNAQRAGPQFYQQAKVWHAQYQAWLTQRQAVLGYMQLLQQQPGSSVGGAPSTQQGQQQPNSAQLLQQQMLAAAYAGMAGQNGFLPK